MPTLEKILTLQNTVGLHARPAALFVQTAAQFRSTVQVEYAGRVADAKRILQVLQLGAQYHAELRVRAEGDDAAEALAALESLVRRRFDEPE